MKIRLGFASALAAALTSQLGAFSLDFTGNVGTTLPANPLVISVPGYGDVRLDAGFGSNLAVASVYPTNTSAPTLNFDSGETLRVTFLGAQPNNVSFDFAGVSTGENFNVQVDAFVPQAFLVNLNGNGDGAGLKAINWQASAAVPEPSSSLLGVLGASLVVLRRRRA